MGGNERRFLCWAGSSEENEQIWVGVWTGMVTWGVCVGRVKGRQEGDRCV